MRCHRQRDHHRGSLVDLTLHRHLAAMQGNEAFDDRQSEAGAFVPPLICRAGLKERISDSLEIVRRNADAQPGESHESLRR